MEMNELEKKKVAEEHVLEMIRMYRHEWMNDLQVIFGYAKLNKHEALLEYVEKIRDKLIKESYICKLGVPSMELLLLDYRVNVHAFAMEWAIGQELQLEAIPLPDRLTQTVKNVLDSFQDAAQQTDVMNKLRIGLSRSDFELLVRFDYSGGIDSSTFMAQIEKTREYCPSDWKLDTKTGAREAYAELQMPLASRSR